jgi:seryl-tRNA synthetase
MHDIKAIRDDEDGRYVKGWLSRGVKDAGEQVQAILKLDADLRAAQTSFQTAQAKRNDLSKQIGQAKAQKDEARAGALMADVEALKAEIERAHAAEGKAGNDLKDKLAALPNLAADDVPDGEDEAGNVEVGRWSDRSRVPAGRLNATPRDHVDLGAALGMMDFEAAARMSGSRFVVLKSRLARLERAIGQFMLDLQTSERGYLEINPPLLVNDDAMFGTGQLPKFAEDLFSTSVIDLSRFDNFETDESDLGAEERQEILRSSLGPLYQEFLSEFEKMPESIEREEFTAVFVHQQIQRLTAEQLAQFRIQFLDMATQRRFLIPTAEVPLTNLVREQITDEAELPLRLTALTPCFRSEAGASGRDTRGMIRQHQFWKCELVSIATPETAEAEHDHMVASAQRVLERLELPYRTMLLCKGDMGFSARKTFDLEVWLPSQNTYREISSISNCGDFQARRMDARFKRAGEKGGRYVHTLNGSGLAVGRTLVAIMENYQDEGGRIAIPAALQPYMGGATHVGGEE